MKKILLVSCFISIAALNGFAQDTLWHRGGVFGLNFNQASFTNWSAGGENSIAGNVLFNGYAKYRKGKWDWDNTLEMAFGGTKQGKQEIRKTDDKFIVNSKVGYEIKKNLYFTYLFNFRTQFTEGFNYIDDTTAIRISNFLTPGTMLNSLGLDYKPNDDLTLFLSPLTIRTTFVQDQLLIDQSEAANQTLFGVDPGKTMRNEIGAYFVGVYKKEVAKNVILNAKLELFSNYQENPQNVDVNFDLLLSFKVNKFINALLGAQVIYDNDVFVPKTDANAPAGPGTQFKETFGLGFSYKFGY